MRPADGEVVGDGGPKVVESDGDKVGLSRWLGLRDGTLSVAGGWERVTGDVVGVLWSDADGVHDGASLGTSVGSWFGNGVLVGPKN